MVDAQLPQRGFPNVPLPPPSANNPAVNVEGEAISHSNVEAAPVSAADSAAASTQFKSDAVFEQIKAGLRQNPDAAKAVNGIFSAVCTLTLFRSVSL